MICKRAIAGLFLFALVFPLEAGEEIGKNPIRRDCCDLGPPFSNRLGMAVSGGDSDFGQQLVMIERKDYRSLSFSARAAYELTNNAALSESDRLRDSYFLTTADVLFRPILTNSLFADAELSYYRYRYDKNSSLDIDEQDARLGLIYMPPRLANTSLFAHYTFDRLLDGRNHDEIYSSHGVQVGVHKGFAMGARQSVYLRAYSKFGLEDHPDFVRRNEYNFVAAYQIMPTDSIEAELFYRARLYDFRNDRRDLNHLFGLSLSYWFSEVVGITGSVTATINNSDERGGDYEAIDGGASIAVNFTF